MSCGRFGCKNSGKSKCGKCLKIGYCSSECQKSDWKLHKIICNKSSEKQPLNEILSIIGKLKKYADKCIETNEKIQIFEQCLSFAEYQFGERIIGKPYREIYNNILTNVKIELESLVPQYFNLGDLYYSTQKNIKLSDTCKSTMIKSIFYFEKILQIFEYWEINFNLVENETTQELNIYMIYDNIAITCHRLSLCHNRLYNYDKCITYCDKSIYYTKLLTNSERKIVLLYESLELKGRFLSTMSKFDEARTMFEDAYNIMAETYDPSHPKVLAIGSLLIDVLIVKEEYYDAERFSRICYECLKRVNDHESYLMCKIMQDLANASFHLFIMNNNTDTLNLLEIEMLLRNSINIEEKKFGHDSIAMITLLLQLVNVIRLFENENRDNEIKAILEDILAISIKKTHESPFIFQANISLAQFHLVVADKLPRSDEKIINLTKSKSYYEEAILIGEKIYETDNEQLNEIRLCLSSIINLLNV
jgi:tetratricopeptide (TPR) repeat protein